MFQTGQVADTHQPPGISPGLVGTAFGFPGSDELGMVVPLRAGLLFGGLPLIEEIFLPLQRNCCWAWAWNRSELGAMSS